MNEFDREWLLDMVHGCRTRRAEVIAPTVRADLPRLTELLRGAMGTQT